MRTVSLNGTNYSVPEPGDTNYDQQLSTYLLALATAFPQLSSSAQQALGAELDLGTLFGIKALYHKSPTANPALSGLLRLAKTDQVVWRNNGNTQDLPLGISGSDALQFNGQNLLVGSTIIGTAAATGGVAVILDNATAQTSGKILSLRTGGVEKASVDWFGTGFLAALVNSGQVVFQKRTTVADAAYTALLGDYVVAYTSLTATRIVTLPSPNVGQILIIKDEAGTASATVKIQATAASGQFDGVAAGTPKDIISAPFGCAILYSSAGNWFSESLGLAAASTGDSAWTAVTPGTNVTNAGAPYFNLGCFKDAGGFVHVRGRVNTTNANPSTIAVLPTGYRPASTMTFVYFTNGGSLGACTIDNTGTITQTLGNLTNIALDGLTFDTRS